MQAMAAWLILCAALSAQQVCTQSPSFYAAGASFNSNATPNLAGFVAVAVPLVKCGSQFQTYSFTIHNITPRGHGKDLRFLDSTTTGAAVPLKQIGPIDIYAFGSMGVTTSSGDANLAGSYGGLISFPLWKKARLRGLLAAQKIEGLSVYGLGFGGAW